MPTGPENINVSVPQKSSELAQLAQEKFGLPALPESRALGLDKVRDDLSAQKRVVLPYIKLLQSMSDDVSIEGLKPGVFRNSLTGESYGSSIEILPIGILHWRRRFSGRDILCTSNDARFGTGDPGGNCLSCPLSKWAVIKENGEQVDIKDISIFRAKKGEEVIKPECSEQFNFPSLVLNSEFQVPGALVFQRTSFTEGLNLYSMLDAERSPMVYKVMAIAAKGDLGNWFTPKVSVLRRASEEEIKIIQEIRSRFNNTVIDVSGVDPENGS